MNGGSCMAEPKKYWFVQLPNWTTGLPVTWQGWALLFGVFAVEVIVARALQGPLRLVAFIAVALGFFLLAHARTQVVPRDS
jgi:hypothetical protein